ncbi:MAG: lysophospholipase [Chloroflexota bacterium]
MPHFETKHTTHDGIELYLQAWIPDEAKAGILLLHGLAEHSGRYAYMAEKLNAAGYAVYTFDGRNHGKSATGKPNGFVESVAEYEKDIDALLKKTIEHMDGKPVFLIGHSMGGGLAANYVINHKPNIQGVVLSGAAVMAGDDISPFLIRISKILSSITPKLATTKFDGDSISRDPEIVSLYNSDPLNYRGGMPARTGAQLLSVIENIQANASKISLPILIMHGTADRITNVKGSSFLNENVSTSDKTLKLYDGLYHEIFNEPEKDEVIGDVIAWLDARV